MITKLTYETLWHTLKALLQASSSSESDEEPTTVRITNQTTIESLQIEDDQVIQILETIAPASPTLVTQSGEEVTVDDLYQHLLIALGIDPYMDSSLYSKISEKICMEAEEFPHTLVPSADIGKYLKLESAAEIMGFVFELERHLKVQGAAPKDRKYLAALPPTVKDLFYYMLDRPPK